MEGFRILADGINASHSGKCPGKRRIQGLSVPAGKLACLLPDTVFLLVVLIQQRLLLPAEKEHQLFHCFVAGLFRHGIGDAALLNTDVDDIRHVIGQLQIAHRLHKDQDDRDGNGACKRFEVLEKFSHKPFSFLSSDKILFF